MPAFYFAVFIAHLEDARALGSAEDTKVRIPPWVGTLAGVAFAFFTLSLVRYLRPPYTSWFLIGFPLAIAMLFVLVRIVLVYRQLRRLRRITDIFD